MKSDTIVLSLLGAGALYLLYENSAAGKAATANSLTAQQQASLQSWANTGVAGATNLIRAITGGTITQGQAQQSYKQLAKQQGSGNAAAPTTTQYTGNNLTQQISQQDIAAGLNPTSTGNNLTQQISQQDIAAGLNPTSI